MGESKAEKGTLTTRQGCTRPGCDKPLPVYQCPPLAQNSHSVLPFGTESNDYANRLTQRTNVYHGKTTSMLCFPKNRHRWTELEDTRDTWTWLWSVSMYTFIPDWEMTTWKCQQEIVDLVKNPYLEFRQLGVMIKFAVDWVIIKSLSVYFCLIRYAFFLLINEDIDWSHSEWPRSWLEIQRCLCWLITRVWLIIYSLESGIVNIWDRNIHLTKCHHGKGWL